MNLIRDIVNEEIIERSIVETLHSEMSVDPENASNEQYYKACAMVLRELSFYSIIEIAFTCNHYTLFKNVKLQAILNGHFHLNPRLLPAPSAEIINNNSCEIGRAHV